jgi:site-specific DNA recombinase
MLRIARGRSWLKEVVEDASITVEGIAKRERCSIRKVNMTISLAFLAPDLVKVAVEGRLPHGMGVAPPCRRARGMVSAVSNAGTLCH